MNDNAYPLGNFSVETFLRDYWQKQPLLIRNAMPDFTPPIDANELAGLACESEVESRLIQFDPAADRWQLSHGPFEEQTFAKLPQKHWTLLVQAVDHWIPEAADLMQRFSFIPNWRVDDLMISYATDGGGVGPHYDNYDVFLLQVEGTRRWELGARCDEHSPRREDAPVMILPEWEAEQSWVLEPGDMLYLPPQIAHNGVAVGDGCITYSIGFRAPAHNEILRSFSDFIGEQLGREMRYADPDLALQHNPGEITPAALDRVETILRSYLSDRNQLATWMGCYMTEPKYPELGEENEPIDNQVLQDWLEQGARLTRNEGARLAYIEIARDNVLLFADGQRYTCLDRAAELARSLCASRHVQPDLPLTADGLALLCQLVSSGSLYLDDGTD